jgi:hypothetical protein
VGQKIAIKMIILPKTVLKEISSIYSLAISMEFETLGLGSESSNKRSECHANASRRDGYGGVI